MPVTDYEDLISRLNIDGSPLSIEARDAIRILTLALELSLDVSREFHEEVNALLARGAAVRDWRGQN